MSEIVLYYKQQVQICWSRLYCPLSSLFLPKMKKKPHPALLPHCAHTTPLAPSQKRVQVMAVLVTLWNGFPELYLQLCMVWEQKLCLIHFFYPDWHLAFRRSTICFLMNEWRNSWNCSRVNAWEVVVNGQVMSPTSGSDMIGCRNYQTRNF